MGSLDRQLPAILRRLLGREWDWDLPWPNGLKEWKNPLMDDGILVHYYGVGFDRYTCNSWSYSFTLFTKFTSFLGEVSCLKGNLSLIQTSFGHPAQNISVES
jgi:hypothetical protein